MTSKKNLFYLWVLLFIFLGGLLGVLSPELAVKLKPVGDGFLSLVKMVIGPVIFCTIVLGISESGDLKKVGRVGLKTILYFEVVSSFALIIGLVVANTWQPGKSFPADATNLSNGADSVSVQAYSQQAHQEGFVNYILHIIPKTFFDAFTANGDLLQILLISILFGVAINQIGEVGKPVKNFLNSASAVLFRIVNMIMKLAPLGAGGAMAFTIGKYGLESLRPLISLMLCFYFSCAVFIIFVLGIIARFTGFSVFKFLLFIKDEILTVLATSSSESVLVPLMQKMEKLGCSKSIVGLVVPTGYSFNLDGTNIYLTMAALFVAQAMGIDLSLADQLLILGVAVLTSKGASGVTVAGFITLAATLAVVPKIPIAGLALILGVDRFMSEARAITNMIGNGIATMFIAKWENELDKDKMRIELR